MSFILAKPFHYTTHLHRWTFEFVLILSGILGTTELSSSAILYQVSVFCYMFPLGLSISASTLVGNSLVGVFYFFLAFPGKYMSVCAHRVCAHVCVWFETLPHLYLDKICA